MKSTLNTSKLKDVLNSPTSNENSMCVQPFDHSFGLPSVRSHGNHFKSHDNSYDLNHPTVQQVEDKL